LRYSDEKQHHSGVNEGYPMFWHSGVNEGYPMFWHSGVNEGYPMFWHSGVNEGYPMFWQSGVNDYQFKLCSAILLTTNNSEKSRYLT
jgi:hypothetical protein